MAEKEYIEREALLKQTAFKASDIIAARDGLFVSVEGIRNALKSIPTADVVEVVRCKDCCFGEEKVDVGGIIRVCTLRDDNRFAVLGTDFCNYGAKMDGKGECE